MSRHDVVLAEIAQAKAHVTPKAKADAKRAAVLYRGLWGPLCRLARAFGGSGPRTAGGRRRDSA